MKIKLDKDTGKKYRLIKETNLQPYTFKNEKEVVCLNEPKLQKNCQSTDLQAYIFKNEKEVVCRNEPKLQKNCQSNSPTSDDESIEYYLVINIKNTSNIYEILDIFYNFISNTYKYIY